jgi:beta-lactamase class A
MRKQFHPALLLFLFISCKFSAQLPDSLRQKIQQVLSAKNAVVGVSIAGSNEKDTLSINGDKHLPMQSVFKFHIALVVLSEVDKGKLALDQKISIEKKDLLPGLYSPLRENTRMAPP